MVYRELIHGQCNSGEACSRIEGIINEGIIYSNALRCLFAFVCAAAICPISFAGSFVDMLVAGTLSAAMMALNLLCANEHPIMGNIFE